MIVPCKKCGRGISDQAICCPHCGSSQTKTSSKKWILILLILIIIGSGFAYVLLHKEDGEQPLQQQNIERSDYEDLAESPEEEIEIDELEPEEVLPEEALRHGGYFNHNY